MKRNSRFGTSLPPTPTRCRPCPSPRKGWGSCPPGWYRLRKGWEREKYLCWLRRVDQHILGDLAAIREKQPVVVPVPGRSQRELVQGVHEPPRTTDFRLV